ncbi:MAG: MinD/ParA family protein [Gammaproteobacteria bacterium]|nr:MinD/ParA family protein [Gammaproteobacteria bacterium]
MDTKSITISSGKGGVGKSCSSVNLAILLAQHGYETCLLDADANLANINIMLKLVPEFTLEQVISGEKTLSEITLYKEGIEIIPGYSGLSDFVSLSKDQRQRLIQALQQLKSKYDYLLIDNPAGISQTVLSFIKFSTNNIIVITPEPTSLTDAFSLIRVASKSTGQKHFQILLNQVTNRQQADSVFKRFSMAVEKHIGLTVSYLGHIISDDLVTASICMQNPVVLEHPGSAAAYCFEEICKKLLSLPGHNNSQSISETTFAPAAATPQTQPTTSSSLNRADTSREQPPTTIESLQDELLGLIADDKQSQQGLKQALISINAAYIKRFGETDQVLSGLLEHAVNTSTVAEPALRNLLTSLYSQYQEKYGSLAENTATTTGQSASENAFTEKSLDHVIKLLQDQKLSHLQQLINQKQQTPQLPQQHDNTENSAQAGLRDSIKYAAMTDTE